jgi:4-oxalmesaconate hydratase
MGLTETVGDPGHLVIDCHAHLVAPDALYVYRSSLLAMGEYARNLRPAVDDAQLAQAASRNVAILDAVGTDMQLLSPRPYMQMQSARPPAIVHWWIRANNDLISRTVQLHPTRFAGVGGLPLCYGEPIESCFEELDRCVEDGFVGVSLNPDPGEGLGVTPPMGDPYWYPLYEKLVAHDLPAMIHSSACHDGRENYSEHFITEESVAILSILRSNVFRDFPELRLLMPHGGGSVPYQIGRWQAARALPGLTDDGGNEPFEVSLRRFWFDTVLYNEASLRLLFEVVGPDRCLFGTEKPGSGSAKNAASGRDYDDLKPVLDGIASLTPDDRIALFEGNARRVFPRLDVPPKGGS